MCFPIGTGKNNYSNHDPTMNGCKRACFLCFGRALISHTAGSLTCPVSDQNSKFDVPCFHKSWLKAGTNFGLFNPTNNEVSSLTPWLLEESYSKLADTRGLFNQTIHLSVTSEGTMPLHSFK